MSRDIIEEPINPVSIQEIIIRQDEDLKNLEGRVFDPIEVKPPVHKIQYRSLQLQIHDIEKDLFRKKRQLISLNLPIHGRIVMERNPYNCKTCHNDDCLNHDLEGVEGRIIRNQTVMNGCLAWLPEAES